jgi:glucosamine--fructose-6-phosphate aminotransferase (isomerizing)
MLAIRFGRARGTLGQEEARALIRELKKLPRLVEEVLEKRPIVAHIAEKYHQAQDFLFLGRHVQVPTAYEGALKLKEISYIHAEAYPAGEMKHGPIALIDERLPVVVLATQGPLYEKTLSNIQEVRARGGKVIAVATEGDEEIRKLAQDVVYVPQVHPLLSPMVSVVPLQLLAYEVAVLLGRDVDQPRNLAKSVTVE